MDAPVRVYLTGGLRIESGGVVVDHRAFDFPHAQLALAYLVCERGRPVDRAEVSNLLAQSAGSTLVPTICSRVWACARGALAGKRAAPRGGDHRAGAAEGRLGRRRGRRRRNSRSRRRVARQPGARRLWSLCRGPPHSTTPVPSWRTRALGRYPSRAAARHPSTRARGAWRSIPVEQGDVARRRSGARGREARAVPRNGTPAPDACPRRWWEHGRSAARFRALPAGAARATGHRAFCPDASGVRDARATASVGARAVGRAETSLIRRMPRPMGDLAALVRHALAETTSSSGSWPVE